MNYSELVQASKEYSDKQGIEIDDNIDIFIRMAESRINRLLKTREQSARIYTPTVDDQRYYSLPDDYAGMRNIYLDDAMASQDINSTPMDYVTPEKFERLTASSTMHYTVAANQLLIHPTQKAGLFIKIIYYQKVPALDVTNNSNWLSNSHPDIYLAGIVAEIEAFSKNYEVAKVWFERMSLAIDELDNTDAVERWSGSTLTIRSA